MMPSGSLNVVTGIDFTTAFVDVFTASRQQFAVLTLPTYRFAGVAVTVSVVEPLIAPEAAVIVAVPEATPVAWPAVVVTLLTVAVGAEEVVHSAVAVRFCVVPFE